MQLKLHFRGDAELAVKAGLELLDVGAEFLPAPAAVEREEVVQLEVNRSLQRQLALAVLAAGQLHHLLQLVVI